MIKVALQEIGPFWALFLDLKQKVGRRDMTNMYFESTNPEFLCLLFFQISKPHEAVISKTVSVVDAAMVACDKIAYVQSGNLLMGIDNFSGSF